jgi:histidyl-tRNA synthetase
MSSGAPLPGFRDFYPGECAERAHLFRAWRAVANRYAFVEYDGPPLEPLDLYTRKSGDEIVGQLYNFDDKGGRAVALRPEMTPTFARMVASRANALRKPLRWFSMPQLFRYERAQKGRLREHYQLNVDIVGEPGEVADAELLAVAIDILAELGLTPQDVRARVSDRRLMTAALDALGLSSAQQAVAYAVIDKFERQSRDVSAEKLAAAGIEAATAARLFALIETTELEAFVAASGAAPSVDAAAMPLRRTRAHLDALGVGAWIDFDPRIVRGLAYYTGIVFELFDAQGEFRAICGGGRYDTLLQALGGVDLPALGFGMGDVVLGELLRARGLMPAADDARRTAFIVGGPGAADRPYGDALRLARALRGQGIAVDHALSQEKYSTQAVRNQMDAAKKAGAAAVVYFDADDALTAISLAGRMADAPRWSGPAAAILAGDPPLHDLCRWLAAPTATP